jgi:hypothetical protein
MQSTVRVLLYYSSFNTPLYYDTKDILPLSCRQYWDATWTELVYDCRLVDLHLQLTTDAGRRTLSVSWLQCRCDILYYGYSLIHYDEQRH